MKHPLPSARRGFAALTILAASATAASAQGLALRAQDGYTAPSSIAEYALTNNRSSANPIRVFGDYYFFDPANSTMGPILGSLIGGFRASTGLVGLAQATTLYGSRPDPLQSLPYIGLGYSHGYFNSQLSLNADFGLASQSHVHGLFGNANSLDDAVNQLRWAPVMAVNVRYAF